MNLTLEELQELYLDRLLSLLPTGQIDRSRDSNFAKVFTPIANEFARIHYRAEDLIREADPRTTYEMLSDWEAFVGLPDPCASNDLSLGERRDELVRKLKSRGGQSREYYRQVAKELGYDITIDEYRSAACGAAHCGKSRVKNAYGHYRTGIQIPSKDYARNWIVNVAGNRITRATCGRNSCGDTLLKIRSAANLECLFNRIKPAHTNLIFNYS